MAAKQMLTYRRIALGGLALVLAVLAYAWIDGGEEPVRPITQSIAVPEGAR